MLRPPAPRRCKICRYIPFLIIASGWAFNNSESSRRELQSSREHWGLNEQRGRKCTANYVDAASKITSFQCACGQCSNSQPPPYRR
ncbi:hypothetical protein CC2G_002552 [Coprinopsis cinerea AmutBmut pab1-1]|nr:hypothetical protein CC2G_002552 [Coprinopsis cinerea AmutBmut pab1-1]